MASCCPLTFSVIVVVSNTASLPISILTTVPRHKCPRIASKWIIVISDPRLDDVRPLVGNGVDE